MIDLRVGEERTGKPTLVFTIIACVMQFIGYVTPGWIFIGGVGGAFQMGLWYTAECGRSYCTVRSTFELPHNFYISLTIPRILTTIGVIACLVAMILLIVNRRSPQPKKRSRYCATVLLFISGGCAIGAAGKMALSTFWFVGYEDDDDEGMYSIPYSWFLTLVGGWLAIGLFFKLACCNQGCCYNTPSETASPNLDGVVTAPYTTGQLICRKGRHIAASILNLRFTETR